MSALRGRAPGVWGSDFNQADSVPSRGENARVSALPEVSNRPFTWDFVLAVIDNRLGMWVGRSTYERAVALVIGFDMAQPDSIDGPMQKRVSERLGSGSTGWPWALMREALGDSPGSGRDLNELSAEQNAIAIAHLVRELRAVLAIPAS